MAPKRPVRLVQSELWLGRTEFEDLIRQRGPEIAEAPRCAGTRTNAIEVRPLVGRPSRVSPVAPLFAPVPAIAEDDGLIRLDGLEPARASDRPSTARSRRVPRWAAAGLVGLAIAGSAVSVFLLTSQGEAAKVTTKNPAPTKAVPAIPSPSLGDDSSSEPIEAGQIAAGASNPPEDVTVRSAPASVPASRTARSDNRTTAPPKHADSVTAPSPASRIAADEIHKWWSEAVAAYGPRNPRWTHSSPESPPWP